jgi:hypothetical protein
MVGVGIAFQSLQSLAREIAKVHQPAALRSFHLVEVHQSEIAHVISDDRPERPRSITSGKASLMEVPLASTGNTNLMTLLPPHRRGVST